MVGSRVGSRVGSPLGYSLAESGFATIPDVGTHTAWWRGDLGVTIGAGGVTAWTDQIGGAVLAQSTEAERPQLVSASFGTPALYFDIAGSDNLTTTDAGVVALTAGADQPWTAMLVADTDQTSGVGVAIAWSDVDLDTDFIYCGANDTSVRAVINDGGSTTTRTGTNGYGTKAVVVFRMSAGGTAIRAYVNGGANEISAGFNEGSLSIDTFSVGALVGASGVSLEHNSYLRVPELSLWDGSLSEANINTVGEYMAALHGAPWTTITDIP